MKCHVYRSSVKDGLYVYVPATEGEDGKIAADGTYPAALTELPPPVRRQLGRPELAMTLELDPGRRLGQEDTAEVLANLASRGFHVQMPRDIEPLVEAVARDATEGSAARRGKGD